MDEFDYRVNLDIYNGPLDLLLYLIRREEVDIHNIPIARITQQYLQYVEMLKQVDPNLSGDFLVMAATLMEIKTRFLLPAAETEDGETEELGLDPREELVRQLLQYKAFKDAADELHHSADQHGRRFSRRPTPLEADDDQKDRDLEELQIWDLFDAFRDVLDAIGARPDNHEVIYDDTPVELHQEDILDRLGRDGQVVFRQLFEGRQGRSELVGLFIALLELVRLRKVIAKQDENFNDIAIELNPNPPEEDSDADFDTTEAEYRKALDEAKRAAGQTPDDAPDPVEGDLEAISASEDLPFPEDLDPAADGRPPFRYTLEAIHEMSTERLAREDQSGVRENLGEYESEFAGDQTDVDSPADDAPRPTDGEFGDADGEEFDEPWDDDDD